MKYLLLMLLLTASMVSFAAQTSSRRQRPTKNPPQFPHVIDLENKDAQKTYAEPESTTSKTAQEPAAELVQAIGLLTGELRTLVQEMRALNVRQQAQLDMLRLTRGDLRVDNYEREQKAVIDRLAQLETEEQSLQAAMTPENLAAQISRFGTIDRDATMQQIKQDIEVRLRAVQTEKERLQGRDGELKLILNGLRTANEETERRMMLVEEALRQLTMPLASEEKKPASPEGRP